MNRECFESMRPIEVPREHLKEIIRGKDFSAFLLFELVGLVDSYTDFKRECKNGALKIENGHLNFKSIRKDHVVKECDFIDDILLLKKGKTQVKAVRL